MTYLNDQYERSHCACSKCKAACCHMPGTCAPGDIERITSFFGVELTPDFIDKNFRASEGFKAIRHDQPISIPTIVPAQKANGECVFYANGNCTIHDASPFGCAQFRVCDGSVDGSLADDEKLKALAGACENDIDYVRTWGHLHMRKLNAPPIAERKAALLAALDQI